MREGVINKWYFCVLQNVNLTSWKFLVVEPDVKKAARDQGWKVVRHKKKHGSRFKRYRFFYMNKIFRSANAHTTSQNDVINSDMEAQRKSYMTFERCYFPLPFCFSGVDMLRDTVCWWSKSIPRAASSFLETATRGLGPFRGLPRRRFTSWFSVSDCKRKEHGCIDESMMTPKSLDCVGLSEEGKKKHLLVRNSWSIFVLGNRNCSEPPFFFSVWHCTHLYYY